MIVASYLMRLIYELILRDGRGPRTGHSVLNQVPVHAVHRWRSNYC